MLGQGLQWVCPDVSAGQKPGPPGGLGMFPRARCGSTNEEPPGYS